MMPGGVFLIVMVGFALWGITRDVRREMQISRDAATPACCALCKYEATADSVARGRCSECGALYLLAGVEGAHQRVLNKIASKSLYAWVVVLSLTLMIASAVTVDFYSSALGGRGNTVAISAACCISVVMLLGVLPCWLISRRRTRVMRDLRERMMPKSPEDVITKDDGDDVSHRLD